MKEEKMTVEKVLKRCMEAANCATLEELANFWATSPELIQEAAEKDRFPSQWFSLMLLKTDCDPLWLLSGEGCPFPNKKAPSGAK